MINCTYTRYKTGEAFWVLLWAWAGTSIAGEWGHIAFSPRVVIWCLLNAAHCGTQRRYHSEWCGTVQCPVCSVLKLPARRQMAFDRYMAGTGGLRALHWSMGCSWPGSRCSRLPAGSQAVCFGGSLLVSRELRWQCSLCVLTREHQGWVPGQTCSLSTFSEEQLGSQLGQRKVPALLLQEVLIRLNGCWQCGTCLPPLSLMALGTQMSLELILPAVDWPCQRYCPRDLELILLMLTVVHVGACCPMKLGACVTWKRSWWRKKEIVIRNISLTVPAT